MEHFSYPSMFILGYNRHIRPAKRGRSLQGQSAPRVYSEMGLHYYSCCAPAHF